MLGVVILNMLEYFIQVHQIHIFQRLLGLKKLKELILGFNLIKLHLSLFTHKACHIACHDASFQIKLENTITRKIRFICILHYHDVDWYEVLGFYCKQPIYPRQHRHIIK